MIHFGRLLHLFPVFKWFEMIYMIPSGYLNVNILDLKERVRPGNRQQWRTRRWVT